MKNLFLYTGSYNGTGTYGSNSPISITFPFVPHILFLPVSTSFIRYSDIPINCFALTTSYKEITGSQEDRRRYYKISPDRKTIYWYCYSDGAANQLNVLNYSYFYAAIGGYDYGGETEWLFTESQTWIVPKTGNYHLELYGNGGRSAYKDIYESGSAHSGAATGGTSCQLYDSISLTKGSAINIVCYPYISGQNPRGSSFGSYSVAAGGDGTVTYSSYTSQFIVTAGKGSGNKGVDGATDTQYNYGAQVGRIHSSRKYSSTYGYSESAGNYDANTNKYSPRAVYLSYLGN